ncbi:MAG: hypothetical protein ACRES1_09050 [Steroidobacteraceae bacterium]
MKPGEGGQRHPAERATGLRQADRAAGRLFEVNIDRVTRDYRVPRYAALPRHEWEGAMRHFQLLPLAVASLSLGVSAGSTEGALVASARAAH